MAAAARYNPWRDLRRRAHLELAWAELDGARGVIVGYGPQRVVYLDHRLRRRDRAAVLAHELVHDERGILYDHTTPPALVDKEEVTVERIVARRLVPGDELRRLVAGRTADGDPVDARLVADEFDVADDVAELALELLRLDLRAGAA
jgi:hypothetical protein